MIQTISNFHYKQFLYGYDVPQSMHDDYDHLDDDTRSDGWIMYKGSFYHTSDFMRIDDESSYWQGSHGLSAFCSVVIKLSDCGEGYQIGMIQEVTDRIVFVANK